MTAVITSHFTNEGAEDHRGKETDSRLLSKLRVNVKPTFSAPEFCSVVVAGFAEGVLLRVAVARHTLRQ